jgi:hypothetical protein
MAVLAPEDIEYFESMVQSRFPPALLAFLSDEVLVESFPVQFRFTHVPFIVELQFLLSLRDPANYDRKSNRLRFAKNSDGYDLLVDLSSPNLPILQDEFGDVDDIGVSIVDLLNAERCAA